MKNNKITEGIKQIAEMFKNAHTDRKAFVFMPDIEQFKVYEVSEEIAKTVLISSTESFKEQRKSPLDVVSKQSQLLKSLFEKHRNETGKLSMDEPTSQKLLKSL